MCTCYFEHIRADYTFHSNIGSFSCNHSCGTRCQRKKWMPDIFSSEVYNHIICETNHSYDTSSLFFEQKSLQRLLKFFLRQYKHLIFEISSRSFYNYNCRTQLVFENIKNILLGIFYNYAETV